MDAPFNSPSSQSNSIFSAQGRIGRMTYFSWLFALNFISSSIIYTALFASGLMMALASVLYTGQFSSSQSSTAFLVFIIIVLLAIYCVTFYLSIIFTIRRLHDRNHSGWLSLLLLCPLVNFIFMLYLYFAKGNEGINQFGVQRVTQGWEKVVTWIGIVFSVICTLLMAVFISIAIKNNQDLPTVSQIEQTAVASEVTQ